MGQLNNNGVAAACEVDVANAVTMRILSDAVRAQLGDSFDGSINWYVTSVKLDLEARSEVERIPGKRPQILRLSQT